MYTNKFSRAVYLPLYPEVLLRRLFLWGILSILLIGSSFAQRNLTLYHMQQIVQTNNVNPGFIPDAQIYGGIPFLSAPNFAWGNRGFNFKDFGLNRPTKGTVDYAQARANGSQMNYATADASFEILNLGYRHRDHFFTFGLTDYLDLDVRFSKEFLQFVDAYQSSKLSPGRTYDLSNFNIDFNHFRAIYLGYAHRFGDRLSFGGKFKLLSGLESIRTTNNQFGFAVYDEAVGVAVVNNLDILSSGMDVWFGDGYSGWYIDGNWGIAFDFGGRFQVNDKVEVSASVVNLGFLKWNRRLSRSTINYVMTDNENIGTFADDLIDQTKDELADGNGNYIAPYFTSAGPQIYGGVSYQIDETKGVGLVLNSRFYHDRTDFGAAVSYNMSVAQLLNFGFSYSFYNNNFFNIGAGVSVNAGPAQIYLVSDNILGAIVPGSFNNAHLNLGVNLLFNRDYDNKLNNPITGDSLTNTEPIALLDEEPEEGSLNLGSRNTEDTRAFIVRGVVRDQSTGKVIAEAVYIDVYKAPTGGIREMVNTRRFPNGSFEFQITKSSDMHELKVESWGYEPTTVHFYATGDQPDKEIALAPKVAAPVTTPAVTTTTEEETPVVEETPAVTAPATTSTPVEAVKEEEPVVEETPAPEFTVTQRTSLRTEAASSSSVILRLPELGVVKVLEETNQWWWKVDYNGKEGFVKKALLKPIR